MPFILFLIAGAVVGTMISCLATDDSLNSGQNTEDPPADQPRDGQTNFGHSNGGHSAGGYFTHRYGGYREGHHRRRADGSYIY